MGEALLTGFLLLLIELALLAAATWAVNRFLTRPILRRSLGGRLQGAALFATSWLVTIVLVLAAFSLSSQPGRSRFEQLCAEHTKPRIVNPVRVDGFYTTLSNPYAKEYLGHSYRPESDPFTFVEGPGMDGGHTRYTWVEDRMREEKIVELRSRHGVREEKSRPFRGIEMRRKTVYEIGSEKPIAEAAIVEFDGGPLPSLFFGSFAKSTCTEALDSYFHLEKAALRIPAP